MSIQSEIERINTNVQTTLHTVAETGVDVPAGATSDNLPAAVSALANNKQDKIAVSGILKGNGSTVQQAVAGTDYAPAPIISQTDITAGSTALATGQSYHVYE